MQIKYVGVAIIGAAVLLAAIVASLTIQFQALAPACPHPEGTACPYAGRLPTETYLGITVVLGLIGIGAYLIYKSRATEVTVKERKEKVVRAVKTLAGDEKIVYDAVSDAEGILLQSELIQRTGMSKVKASRVLDRLETKGLVERRRRGMTNVIVLKE